MMTCFQFKVQALTTDIPSLEQLRALMLSFTDGVTAAAYLQFGDGTSIVIDGKENIANFGGIFGWSFNELRLAPQTVGGLLTHPRGIDTVGDLIVMTREELLGHEPIDEMALSDISVKLSNYGLTLRGIHPLSEAEEQSWMTTVMRYV